MFDLTHVKTMAAECYFASEQLINSITRSSIVYTVLIIVQKRDVLMLEKSIQSACSKCPPTAFCMSVAYCGTTVGLLLALIWAWRQVGSDCLHNVFHLRKCCFRGGFKEWPLGQWLMRPSRNEKRRPFG